MLKVLNYYLLVISLLLWGSCGDKEKHLNDTSPKQLSSDQILQLIEESAVQFSDGENFHIFYKEYLNDSTWVISVDQNEILGNEEFGICEVLKSKKGNNIFVYAGVHCNNKLNDSLKSKNGEWPTRFDGVAFSLLVEVRNGLLDHYRLNKHFRFDNNLPDSSELNLFDLK